MGIIVQKYGGKLVENKEKMEQVANSIISSYNQGNKVVVVVSATGNTTDELNSRIHEITDKPNLREVDVVLASGEQIAIGLLAIMLNNMGYKTISLTGLQAGIQTDNYYTNSNILNINTHNITKFLEEGYIVIVAGFQGVDKENNITTLGRGGSDTTATELAVYLNADRCEIYKDTQCIYTADPKIIPTAKKLNQINYNYMLELSKMGAKVLAYKSIKYAKENNLNLVIKSVEDNTIGTVINNENCNTNLPFISCTKKTFDNDKDIITFITNKDLKNEIYIILKANKIVDFLIQQSNNKISIIIKNTLSSKVLKQLHDHFILQ